MEQAIRGALLKRGTLYRDIPAPLVAQLEAVANQHGLDAKGLAGAFDKFMTTSRCGRAGLAGERGRAAGPAQAPARCSPCAPTPCKPQFAVPRACRAESTAGVTPEDVEAFAEHQARASRAAPLSAARGDNLFARMSWEE